MSGYDYDPEFDFDGDGVIDDDELYIEMETFFGEVDDLEGNNSGDVNYSRSSYSGSRSSGSRNLTSVEAFICVIGGLIGTAAVLALLGLEDFPVILIIVLWFGFGLLIAWILSKF